MAGHPARCASIIGIGDALLYTQTLCVSSARLARNANAAVGENADALTDPTLRTIHIATASTRFAGLSRGSFGIARHWHEVTRALVPDATFLITGTISIAAAGVGGRAAARVVERQHGFAHCA